MRWAAPRTCDGLPAFTDPKLSTCACLRTCARMGVCASGRRYGESDAGVGLAAVLSSDTSAGTDLAVDRGTPSRLHQTGWSNSLGASSKSQSPSRSVVEAWRPSAQEADHGRRQPPPRPRAEKMYRG